MSKNKNMGASSRKNEVLKVLHPRRPPEIYRKPITAGEIMKRHPRYCIARPDVFQFPWIVVHPNSILVPGKTFYLVPYRTLDKLVKEKRKQLENFLHEESQATTGLNSLAGITPTKIQLHGRQLHDDEYNIAEESPVEQDSDTGSSYKEDFIRSWETLQKNLQRTHENGDQGLSALDSPFDRFSLRARPRVESPEQQLLRLKSCLRKPDSERKKLIFKVRFASAVVIPGSQRVSPSDE